MCGLVISVTLVISSLIKPETNYLKKKNMNEYMKVGRLIISPGLFNILPLFLGRQSWRRDFLKEGGWVCYQEGRNMPSYHSPLQ